MYIKKNGDSITHANLVERVIYVRLCCIALPSSPAAQPTDINNDNIYIKFKASIIPSFKKLLAEKLAIIEEDKKYEAEIQKKFPNFAKNAYQRSFIESVFAAHAIRSTYFIVSWSTNLFRSIHRVSQVRRPQSPPPPDTSPPPPLGKADAP